MPYELDSSDSGLRSSGLGKVVHYPEPSRFIPRPADRQLGRRVRRYIYVGGWWIPRVFIPAIFHAGYSGCAVSLARMVLDTGRGVHGGCGGPDQADLPPSSRFPALTSFTSPKMARYAATLIWDDITETVWTGTPQVSHVLYRDGEKMPDCDESTLLRRCRPHPGRAVVDRVAPVAHYQSKNREQGAIMPRTTKTITFSLPPEMAERLDQEYRA